MTNSRQKGATFERFVVNQIKDNLGEHLPQTRIQRNLSQYQTKGEADILIPKWSIECKAYADGNSYKAAWLKQAFDAAKDTDMFPVLIYKFNNKPIRCVVQLMAISRDFTYNPDLVCEVSLPAWFEIVRESYGVDNKN